MTVRRRVCMGASTTFVTTPDPPRLDAAWIPVVSVAFQTRLTSVHMSPLKRMLFSPPPPSTVGGAYALKIWRCKVAHLMHWQGFELRREHRKALEGVFLEAAWAMNHTYYSDAHDRIVLTGPRS
mmetsp:Transcript_68575/g.121295  ORF Transcript_68575/g.121295 Transcript_68575/m.121295 type:complete len:124 (-) Transcript_68575:14-385(-)